MGALTKKQAVEFIKSGKWKNWDSEQIVRFQFSQKYLCVDYDVFHSALEDMLGRQVLSDELGSNYKGLREEFLEKHPAPRRSKNRKNR